MYAKLNSYFNPSSRSLRRQASGEQQEAFASDQSEYNSAASTGSEVPLRFIIIRHGERVDVTFGGGWTKYAFNNAGQYYAFAPNMPPSLPYRANCFDYDVDTPLTANGLKQSWNVGNVLANYQLPVTACYSSPAFRSIQTADRILEGMGRKGQVPLRLELGLFECSSWYADSPINFMSDEELLHAGINVDTQYRSQLKNLRLLENEYQYYDRSKETMKKLIKLHQKRGGTVLLVAHAPSLEVLTRHLMNGQPRPERLAELAGKVDYCSMTIVEGDPVAKAWRFRYSLDPQINWQQQQQSNQTLDRSMSESLATGGYLPSASFRNYNSPMLMSPTQFQFVPQQEAFPPHFVL